MLGWAGGVRGSDGSGTGAGASTISNVRTAAARLSSISRNASPSGCTASYAANATSGSEARNTPSIPPSRTPGIASASTASPAAPARIAPAPAPAPRIDARVRRSPSIARDHPVRSSPSLPSRPNAVRSARPDRSLVNPAWSSARAAIERSEGRRARRRVASGTASPPIARNASRTRASAGSNAARIAHANATARIAATGGTRPRTKNASSVSTSATVRASRSPLRNPPSPPGASGSIARNSHTRISVRTRRAARCTTYRSE